MTYKISPAAVSQFREIIGREYAHPGDGVEERLAQLVAAAKTISTDSTGILLAVYITLDDRPVYLYMTAANVPDPVIDFVKSCSPVTPETQEFMQRIGAFALAVSDAVDTPEDIRECADELVEEIERIFSIDSVICLDGPGKSE